VSSEIVFVFEPALETFEKNNIENHALLSILWILLILEVFATADSKFRAERTWSHFALIRTGHPSDNFEPLFKFSASFWLPIPTSGKVATTKKVLTTCTTSFFFTAK